MTCFKIRILVFCLFGAVCAHVPCTLTMFRLEEDLRPSIERQYRDSAKNLDMTANYFDQVGLFCESSEIEKRREIAQCAKQYYGYACQVLPTIVPDIKTILNEHINYSGKSQNEAFYLICNLMTQNLRTVPEHIVYNFIEFFTSLYRNLEEREKRCAQLIMRTTLEQLQTLDFHKNHATKMLHYLDGKTIAQAAEAMAPKKVAVPLGYAKRMRELESCTPRASAAAAPLLPAPPAPTPAPTDDAVGEPTAKQARAGELQ